jgi:hypothetical protein
MLILAGCDGRGASGPDNQAAAAANQVSASAEAEGAAPAPAPAAERLYLLAADGIEPGIRFGMKQGDAVAAATAAFGPGGKAEHNDECGEGPMDFVSFGGLQLGFQDGKLAGWSLGGTEPALRTKGGVTIGSPRSALGGLALDEESTLGPEFDADGVGGILDENGAKVVALWAGYPCQFR